MYQTNTIMRIKKVWNICSHLRPITAFIHLWRTAVSSVAHLLRFMYFFIYILLLSLRRRSVFFIIAISMSSFFVFIMNVYIRWLVFSLFFIDRRIRCSLSPAPVGARGQNRRWDLHTPAGGGGPVDSFRFTWHSQSAQICDIVCTFMKQQ